MRAGREVAAGIVLSLLVLGIARPVDVRAANPDPTPTIAPTARPPTCAERFPADGPAGVDLQLGCIVNEIVGTYLGAATSGPADAPRLSGYLTPVMVVLLAAVGLVLIARAARRRAGRRLAAANPAAWWSCRACRSLNAAGRTSCYRCGRPFEPGDVEMRTDAEPPASQSFGRRQDRP